MKVIDFKEDRVQDSRNEEDNRLRKLRAIRMNNALWDRVGG